VIYAGQWLGLAGIDELDGSMKCDRYRRARSARDLRNLRGEHALFQRALGACSQRDGGSEQAIVRSRG